MPPGFVGPASVGEGVGSRGSELVLLVTRGVASLVALSAVTLVLVLLIIAEAMLIVVTEKIGLAPVVLLILACFFAVSHWMGVPFRSLARVLVFLWAF
jgi:hypothetical protein